MPHNRPRGRSYSYAHTDRLPARPPPHPAGHHTTPRGLTRPHPAPTPTTTPADFAEGRGAGCKPGRCEECARTGCSARAFRDFGLRADTYGAESPGFGSAYPKPANQALGTHTCRPHRCGGLRHDTPTGTSATHDPRHAPNRDNAPSDFADDRGSGPSRKCRPRSARARTGWQVDAWRAAQGWSGGAPVRCDGPWCRDRGRRPDSRTSTSGCA